MLPESSNTATGIGTRKTAPVHNFDQNYVSYKMMLKFHRTIWGYKLRHPLYKFDIQIWHFIIQTEASIIQIWHIMTINYVYKFEIALYKLDQIYVKSEAKIYNASQNGIIQNDVEISSYNLGIQTEASIIQIWHLMTINYVYKFEIASYKIWSNLCQIRGENIQCQRKWHHTKWCINIIIQSGDTNWGIHHTNLTHNFYTTNIHFT